MARVLAGLEGGLGLFCDNLPGQAPDLLLKVLSAGGQQLARSLSSSMTSVVFLAVRASWGCEYDRGDGWRHISRGLGFVNCRGAGGGCEEMWCGGNNEPKPMAQTITHDQYNRTEISPMISMHQRLSGQGKHPKQ